MTPHVFIESPPTMPHRPEEESACPAPLHSVDYDGELGVVIGKRSQTTLSPVSQGLSWRLPVVNDVFSAHANLACRARSRRAVPPDWELGTYQRQVVLTDSLPHGAVLGAPGRGRPAGPATHPRVNRQVRQRPARRTWIFSVPEIVPGSAVRQLEPGISSPRARQRAWGPPPIPPAGGNVSRSRSGRFGVLRNRVARGPYTESAQRQEAPIEQTPCACLVCHRPSSRPPANRRERCTIPRGRGCGFLRSDRPLQQPIGRAVLATAPVTATWRNSYAPSAQRRPSSPCPMTATPKAIVAAPGGRACLCGKSPAPARPAEFSAAAEALTQAGVQFATAMPRNHAHRPDDPARVAEGCWERLVIHRGTLDHHQRRRAQTQQHFLFSQRAAAAA